jgi:hypothetical protein
MISHDKTTKLYTKICRLCDKQFQSESRYSQRCPCIETEEGQRRNLYRGHSVGAKKKFQMLDDDAVYLDRTPPNKEYTLTFEQFCFIKSQPCFYCGLAEHERKLKFISGIDRVDSKKGYTIANCVPCCLRCNTMKLADSVQIFLDHVKQIYEYQIQKTT